MGCEGRSGKSADRVFGAGGTLLARRDLLQTLLVGAAREEGVGFASGRVLPYPGSPRLGSADPGLSYAAPLVLVWRRSGVEWQKNSVYRNDFRKAQKETRSEVFFENWRNPRICRRGAERQGEQRRDSISASSAPLPLCGKPNILRLSIPEMIFANRYNPVCRGGCNERCENERNTALTEGHSCRV